MALQAREGAEGTEVVAEGGEEAGDSVPRAPLGLGCPLVLSLLL